MLCYVMLCYVMLCYVMLCYVMLCYVMLFYIILYCYQNLVEYLNVILIIIIITVMVFNPVTQGVEESNSIVLRV